MDGGSLSVPDAIEPISAYRVWRFSIAGRRADLFAMNAPLPQLTRIRNDWEGARATEWMKASCLLTGDLHEAPSEECTCGFYARKQLEPTILHASIAKGLFRLDLDRTDGVVIGRVELAGKVIEHDEGYRAERARIAELIPIHGTERSVMVLANRLGVPIAPAVAPTLPEDVPAPLGVLSGAATTPAVRSTKGSRSSAMPGLLAILFLFVVSILFVTAELRPPLLFWWITLSAIARSADALRETFLTWRSRLLVRLTFGRV